MDDGLPWVTVVCTCYNHAAYVKDALNSVLLQTYSKVELIVVDNCSSDNSVQIIQRYLQEHPSIIFVANSENKGICKAFNEVSRVAKGKYLIDLAADDILMPTRIERQVTVFEKLGEEYGIVYSNIELIDESGAHQGFAVSGKKSPSGDVFASLLEKHFLPSPSTMFRAFTFHTLGGYNESLLFEDFDYWLRCARHHLFYYDDFVSTQKRVLSSSLSAQFYSITSDRMLESTYATFAWASSHLHSSEERRSFEKGICYYFRQSVWLGHFEVALKFKGLLDQPSFSKRSVTGFANLLLKYRLNTSFLYLHYLKVSKLFR